MQIELTSREEAWIRRKVESGEFRDAGEVIREAIRIAAEQEREQRMSELFDEALAQVRRGETIPLSEITVERLMERAKEHNRLGLPISDDVKW